MAQPISHFERELDAAVEQLSQRAFEFLARLVREPSLPGSEIGAEAVLEQELGRIGMDVERVPYPAGLEHDPVAGVGLATYADRSIVVGRLGRAPGTLILNGHLDVVPAGDERVWASPPFEPRIADGWMTGRGAGDMKSGLAMGTLAIEALLAVDHAAASLPLAMAGVIEEERSGNGTLGSIRAGVVGDAAVLLEPTDLSLLVRGIGVLWFEVEVSTASGHALAAETKIGALAVALAVIEGLRALEAELNTPPGPVHHSLNVGTLSAGEWQSSVPSSARIGCRIGFPRSIGVEEAIARVGRSVAAVGERLALPDSLQVRFNGFRGEGYDLADDDPLVAAMAAAHQAAHGTLPAVVGTAGTTDARFYRNQLGIPALCYGPRVENMHAANERVELSSIVAGARTLARFIHRWRPAT